MKQSVVSLLAGFLFLGSAASAAGTRTVTIGFTTSQTGSLNVESVRQTNGLNLWIEQVNNAGGIKLPDGSVVKFAAKFYDDESNKDRVQSLYTKIINDDKADFLISPYSSGLADAAAIIAEQYGKIMITTGAASDSTYQKGFTLVYQAYTPASRYLTGALDLLMKLDPGAKKVAFIHEEDKFSTDVVEAAKAYATAKGFQAVLSEGYDSKTTDFAPFIDKIPAGVDAVMGGGHFADGSTFARQLQEKGVKAKMIALLVAPPEPKFAELGAAAQGVIGPSQWEPLAMYTPDAARAAKLDWYGISVPDFVKSYTAKFHEEPSYHSAGGYAAGLILQRAIEKAGSLETQKIKAALDAMDLMTFFGHLKFDTSAKAHGLQVGHEMIYIQWQRDKQGKLIKQVVWPLEAKTAPAVYPARR
ncbi:MAG TPA: amino acid ABC transporter substrate-binding protein [Candidatus Sulfotelmatobacter sp.]|nr:amino acid ABC transporter substrate-binding protein [Candidatus Sulfotelmatobacter sp.]